MKTKQADAIRLKAEVYFDLINDMQARIFEFKHSSPDCMNEEIRSINRRLSAARMESRIHVDEEHFRQWDRLLSRANAAMIRSRLF